MNGTQTLGSVLAARFEGEGSGRIAIEYRGRTISYAELANASQLIVDKLQRVNVKAGERVGVLAEDSTLILPAMIGVLAHGCVFALLDPAHPPTHLRELAGAVDFACLLVEDTLLAIAAEALPDGSCKPVAINVLIYSAADGHRSVVRLLADARERPLYLYFSSGTSGRPKPILGRADSLMHFVNWEIATLGIDSTMRVSQLTSPSHDPFLRDVFTPLVSGGTVCVPDSRHIVLSPVELGRWLDCSGIEVMHCTPTVFRNLCNGGLAGRTFSRLKYILIGGEQLRGVHLARWYEAFGTRVQLLNLYGPTETTLAKLYYFVSPADMGRGAVPIGQPMSGARARIMATPEQACEAGEIGELYIETAYASLGYFRRPELNSAAFDPDPAESSDRPVVYRTGDLVKRLPDGNIEFVGRSDRQHKIRGKLIDLGLVEDELVKHSEINSCVVSAATGDEDGLPDRLVAFYIAERELEEPALQRHLAQCLPKFMIPDVWIRLDSLPTNDNGKVHDDELAALLSRSHSISRGQGYAEPGVSTQVRLLELWKELLRNDAIWVDDPFMEVGGDSLSIMLLIARLEEDYGYTLSLWEVFDQLTIRKLSASITAAGASTKPDQTSVAT